MGFEGFELRGLLGRASEVVDTIFIANNQRLDVRKV
jgi:hypothetical protein